MLNGVERTSETPSELASQEAANQLLPWLQGHESDCGDESPVLSQYSSCGESEFDRYCSANSVMGTPSLCGSSVGGPFYQDCVDSEFGSLKSFKLENDNRVSESFSLGERTSIKSGHNKGLLSPESCYRDGKSETEVRNSVALGERLVGTSNGFNRYENGEISLSHEWNNMDGKGNFMLSKVGISSDLLMEFDEEDFGKDDLGHVVKGGDKGEGGVSGNSYRNNHHKDCGSVASVGRNVLSLGVDDGFCLSEGAKEESWLSMGIEQVDSYLQGLDLDGDLGFDRKEDGRGSDASETSSRCEHSDGEVSMFGSGTDDEKKINYYQRQNIQYAMEKNIRKENSLLMTSSEAFGTDDWDDFMQETEGNAIMFPGELQGQKQHSMDFERENTNTPSANASDFSGIPLPEQEDDGIDDSMPSSQVQCISNREEFGKACSESPIIEAAQGEDTKDILVISNQAVVIESTYCLETCSVSNIFEKGHDPLAAVVSLKDDLSIAGSGFEMKHPFTSTEQVTGMTDGPFSESKELENITLQFDPLSDFRIYQPSPASQEGTKNESVEFFEESNSNSVLPLAENDMKKIMKDYPVAFNLFDDSPSSVKTENPESNEFYNEFVLEMEEILLDSGNSPGARFNQGNSVYSSHISLPVRDGGPTASTSGMDDYYPFIPCPMRVERVEVIGARQKSGDVSLSERLVGVKEYTLYRIQVWNVETHWEVERRYRDFYTLYRRLKTSSVGQGWILPSPWSSVETESRKIFGNASPDVVAKRSILIQECLQSILHSRFSSSLPNALIWFLSPPKDNPSAPASDTYMPRSPYSTRCTDADDVSTLGKTISLVVEVRPYKSVKQMLDAQHYTCAGCHKHFDDGKTLMREFVQTLGWGKPRLCEYSGQMFCSLCHSNETAVLPARVLHFWDFTQYPVSQLAKSYLDSIHDQPMLCVSAVNPFLFSKVPALQYVMNLRKRIGVMLPYVHCPFRRSIYKGLGSRRYLLESNDFFALRDLIDLSKGVFAALPVMVETVTRKILEHITEQCLLCCDAGVPCNARQACDEPTSLIYPFQDGEVEKCRSCNSVFHKLCLKKIASCPCTAHLKLDDAHGGKITRSLGISSDSGSTLELFGRKWDSGAGGFLSGLFSKTRQVKPRDNATVIVMGSLPGTSA